MEIYQSAYEGLVALVKQSGDYSLVKRTEELEFIVENMLSEQQNNDNQRVELEKQQQANSMIPTKQEWETMTYTNRSKLQKEYPEIYNMVIQGKYKGAI